MMLKLRRTATTLTVLLMITSSAPLIPAASAASAGGIGFSDPIALAGNRHGEPGVRVQRNDLVGGDTSGDRVWVHAFESGWRSDDGGSNWTGEIGTSLALSGDSDMAWGYPGGPNPERVYKTELAQLACEQFFWDDDGSGGAAVNDWMRDDANCGLPIHDRQWLQTGPAVLPDGSILPGAEHVYMIANQIPAGGFLARSTQVAPAQPPHFDFTTPFQVIAANQVLWCTRGFFDVDQVDGSIHIVDCLENGALRVYSSYDGGITWAEEQVSNHRNSTNLFPVISVDDEGGLHVSSSQANGDLLYSYRPEDGPWTEPVTIVAGEGAAANTAVKTSALAWVDAGEGGKANLVYLGSTAGPTPDGVKAPNQWYLWMSQTLDGGRTWSHVQADPHAVQTGCISTAGLPIAGEPECPNRNLVDFIAADHLSDGSAVISYTYGCNGATGCDGVTGQSNGAQTRVVVQEVGSKIRGEGPVGQAELSITSPEDGATVQAGLVDVAGTADRQAGGQEFIANLSGPEDVSTDTAATYSLTATNPEGNLSCSITAEGSPTRANESANGCSVQLTWQNEGSYTVTGEVSDGTSTALDTVQVTVTKPGGIPEPDGSINGGITMFADANPLLAANELAALAASAADPAPKFLPGEEVTFHTRFTEDSSGAVATSGDTFKWHVWNSAGEQVGTMSCLTTADGDLTAPNGFDCVASATLPSDIGRYYTTLRYTKDGRWSCHGAGPLENLAVPNGIPPCLKAFDIVANTSTVNPGASPALPHAALPYFVSKGADISSVEWALRSKGSKTGPTLTAEPAAAPSTIPEDPEVVDPQGDALQLTNPGAGLPVDHLDVEAAWFEDDDDFLYVGLKLNDIPADPNSTAFAAYHVNFRPDWIADPKGAFAVPAANTYTGLRVQGLFSPVGFNGLTNPGTETAHRAELQVLSTSATGNNFSKVSDLQLLSVDPESDIVWWSVPRTALLNPQPGDSLENLSADSAVAMRGQFTLRADLATAVTGRTFEFSGAVEQLVANAGGPYAGPVGAPIAISGSATGGKAPYSCAWTGPALATFADAGACTTTVSLASPGAHQVELTVTDVDGTTSTSSAAVTAGAVTGERVEIYVGGSLAGASAVSTDAGNPTADWTVPVDLSGLSGQHEITARWFDGETLLDEGAITLNVEEVGPEFEINITSPSDGAEVGEDFVIEGTTSEIAPSTQGQGSRSSGRGGQWEQAKYVVDHTLPILTNHGPPVPTDATGIGPGATLITDFYRPATDQSLTGICTAAFVFRDADTAKVYLGAAGHCFLDEDFKATHGPDADWDPATTTRIRVCVASCLGGQSGVESAAAGIYPGTTRDLGPAEGPKVAYARQTAADGDVGNDFGLVEIPESLYDEIRTDMPVWGGPNNGTMENVLAGDVLVLYGNSVALGEVWPTKGRMGIGTGSNAKRWIGSMPSAFGDSGSAVNIAIGSEDSGLEGEWAAGVLTHISLGVSAGAPHSTAGTTTQRALEMAKQAGLDLELVHDRAQLEAAPPQAPTGLAATAGDGTVGLSWTAPSNGGAPISGYTVRWGTQAGGPYPDSRTVTGTEASIDALTNGVTYHFVVSATNSKGEGPNSAEVSATPSQTTTVPGAPQDLSAVAGDGQAVLSWQAPADDGGEPITGYTVKWGPSAGGPYPNTFQVTETATTVTGLTNGMTYHFVVSASNTNGESANSNEVAVTPEAIGDRFAVEVRLGSGEWTAVDAYDGSAWSKAFSDVAGGEVTVDARLLDRGTEVARDSIGLVVDGTEITTVAFTDGSADAGQHTDKATIAARLTDEAGEPISGADLIFELSGENDRDEWTATTGANGVASLDRVLQGAPGTYSLTVHYAGAEGVYEPHSDQRFFVVEKEQTVLDLIVDGKGKKRTVHATLTEDDGPELAGREIVFTVDGTEIGRATTNANGVARLDPPNEYRGDHFLFEASFAGGDSYRGSSGSYRT